jgi:hypothetical protein
MQTLEMIIVSGALRTLLTEQYLSQGVQAAAVVVVVAPPDIQDPVAMAELVLAVQTTTVLAVQEEALVAAQLLNQPCLDVQAVAELEY